MKYLLGTTLLFLSGAALAVPTDGTINQIVGGYNTATSTWEPTIKLYAWRLFWLLVAIDWSWGAMKLATQNSEFDSVLGFLVNRIMVVGFFMALLQFGSSWSIMLIDSFRQLAVAAGGAPNINPSNVMDLGLQIAVELLDKVSLFNPITTTIAGITSIIILIIFALITVELVFVLVSMWVVLYAGIIFLAFGGSSFTQNYALNYYRALLAIGAKLFVIQLLVGVGMTIIETWASTLGDDPTFKEMFVILGGVAVLYGLIKGIGGLVESLVSGSGAASSTGSGAVAGAIAAGGAVAGGAALVANTAKSTFGAGQAVSAASQLAKASGATGPLGTMAATAGNLAKSFGADLSNKVGGDMSAQHGTAGGRMANIMKDQMAENQAKGGDTSGGDSNYISGIQSSDTGAGSKA